MSHHSLLKFMLWYLNVISRKAKGMLQHSENLPTGDAFKVCYFRKMSSLYIIQSRIW